MTCSERDAERFACRLRSQKIARRITSITNARPPRAIPIFAPTLRPPLEEVELEFAAGESVASGIMVVVDGSKDVVIREVELPVFDGKFAGADVISDSEEMVPVAAKEMETPGAGVWRVIAVEGKEKEAGLATLLMPWAALATLKTLL